MAIAVQEFVTGSFVSQPTGYYTFLVGFIIINSIATFIDLMDIYRWFRGERAEQFDTGFFSKA